MDSAAHPAVEPVRPSFVEELVALTAWQGERRPIDRAPAEQEPGLRLPRDCERLVETFGGGSFDDALDLHVPGSPHAALGEFATDGSESADGAVLGGPTSRLLEWASTSAGHSFCRLVEDPDQDPDRWAVHARADSFDPWVRFDCPATEFVHRMLGDPRHPYSLATRDGTHWFRSAEEAARAWEEFRDDYCPRP
ncbi:hypothetical protein [Streptomyces sp. NRRL B-24484]|uniref:hypothetical protein n=1 Tax=Streptomyces sp. NRRL B-24484 TaxID=1463833 RepID=UPI0013319283|nr:hypothetical protein [Streptomyces sp. NRRL B-24484]